MVVGDVGGGGDEDVAWGGEDRPEKQGEPAYACPAEEEIEQKDSGYGVAVVGGDDGWKEVKKGE